MVVLKCHAYGAPGANSTGLSKHPPVLRPLFRTRAVLGQGRRICPSSCRNFNDPFKKKAVHLYINGTPLSKHQLCPSTTSCSYTIFFSTLGIFTKRTSFFTRSQIKLSLIDTGTQGCRAPLNSWVCSPGTASGICTAP